jgi:hypothetical protein
MEQDASPGDLCALCGLNPVAESFRGKPATEEKEFSGQNADCMADELTGRIPGAA